MIITATIKEDANSPEIGLELKKGNDGVWRWYETLTGADTEVSGRTVWQAISRGRATWRAWQFRVQFADLSKPPHTDLIRRGVLLLHEHDAQMCEINRQGWGLNTTGLSIQRLVEGGE